MKICPYCGKSIDTGTTFCPYCGKWLTQAVTPSDGQPAEQSRPSPIPEYSIGKVDRYVTDEQLTRELGEIPKITPKERTALIAEIIAAAVISYLVYVWFSTPVIAAYMQKQPFAELDINSTQMLYFWPYFVLTFEVLEALRRIFDGKSPITPLLPIKAYILLAVLLTVLLCMFLFNPSVQMRIYMQTHADMPQALVSQFKIFGFTYPAASAIGIAMCAVKGFAALTQKEKLMNEHNL